MSVYAYVYEPSLQRQLSREMRIKRGATVKIVDVSPVTCLGVLLQTLYSIVDTAGNEDVCEPCDLAPNLRTTARMPRYAGKV